MNLRTPDESFSFQRGDISVILMSLKQAGFSVVLDVGLNILDLNVGRPKPRQYTSGGGKKKKNHTQNVYIVYLIKLMYRG